MFRTRDLLLFAVAIVFLVMAIGGTLWIDLKANLTVSEPMEFIPGESDSDVVSTEESELDRASIAAHLRQVLSSGGSKIEPEASVTTEADAAVSAIVVGNVALKQCLGIDDVLPKIGNWPLHGTQIAVREGARVFLTTETVTQATAASATTTEVVEKVWLTLPLMAVASGEYCVPSEIIGVTPRGVLIFNHDVADYKNTSANELIGYARDGHPIYGAYTGETDACGGYQHPAGYRYVIKPENDFIIGCFTALPQVLSI